KGKFARASQRLSGMSKEKLFECLTEVDEQTVEFAPLLKLPVPEQSIMSFLAEK
ncbi:MAG: HDOD domain-containing protein, partial [Rhodopirellula bahusiensis]